MARSQSAIAAFGNAAYNGAKQGNAMTHDTELTRRTVMQVAAAAIAAGETPSPEMVAEAGSVGGLRPQVAATLLASLAVAVGQPE